MNGIERKMRELSDEANRQGISICVVAFDDKTKEGWSLISAADKNGFRPLVKGLLKAASEAIERTAS